MLGAVLVGALGWVGLSVRREQDAVRAADEAERLLKTPFSRAPELARIPTARALFVLDLALQETQSPRLQGLHAWATALDNAQKGRAERALPAIEEARKALGKVTELEVLAGIVALQTGDVAGAERASRAALALDARNARAQLLTVDIALETSAAADAGKSEEPAEQALALLDALDRALPDQAGIAGLANRRGIALEALGRDQDALAAYRRATELDPSLAQGHVNLGRLLRDRGAYREAEASFSRAVLAADGNAEAWLGRGLCRMGQGDVVGGALDIEKSRELAPAQSAPLIALADLDSARGEHTRAIDRYRAALLLAPTDAIAWLKLGNALMRTGQHAGARDAFEHAVEHNATLAAAHNGLGAARMALGDHAGALASLNTAVQLDASDPNPARNLALLSARVSAR